MMLNLSGFNIHGSVITRQVRSIDLKSRFQDAMVENNRSHVTRCLGKLGR